MSYHDVMPYVTYLPIFRVVICRFCKVSLPPNDPLEHYKRHHTAKNDHPVPSEIRRKIVDYMATLNLCQPQEVISPHNLVPELKIIEKGFECGFPGCESSATTEK